MIQGWKDDPGRRQSPAVPISVRGNEEMNGRGLPSPDFHLSLLERRLPAGQSYRDKIVSRQDAGAPAMGVTSIASGQAPPVPYGVALNSVVAACFAISWCSAW